MGGDIFALAEARLGWIAQRQSVLAQNIANADTPGYVAQDIGAFDKLLSGQGGVAPVLTDPSHLSGRATLVGIDRPKPRERAPDGNAVSVEGELTKVAEGEGQASLVGNLWKTYMGLYLTALGRGGG